MDNKPTYQELEKELEVLKVTNSLIENSPIVRFIWRNQENWPVEYVTKNAVSIFGYTAEEFMSGKVFYSKIIYSEDLQRVTKEVEENSKTEKTSFEHKPYRVVCKTGEIKWLKDTTLIKRNLNNEITHYEGIVLDITSHINTEIKVKKFSAAVEQSANVIVITDTEGNIEYVNQKFTEVTGYTAKEAKGKNPRILNSGVLPKEYFVKLWDNVSKGNIWKGEFCNITKQGSLYWEQVTITPIKNNVGKIINYLAIKEDITTRKRAEEKLHTQNQKYASLNQKYLNQNNELIIAKEKAEENENKLITFMNSIPDIVCYKDGEGRWLLANDADLELFCLTGVDYFGKTDAELAIYTDEIYKEAFSTCMLTDEKAWQEKAITHVVEIIPTISGIDRTYDVYKIPTFHSDGSRKGLAVIGRDITELQEIQDKLMFAKEKAEESDRLKCEFINNMSHEIRTPMNAILGFSKILEDANVEGEKRKHFIKIIQNSGSQLIRVIDDILEISKLGTNQVKVINNEICLNNLLLEQFSFFNIKAKERKIPLYFKKGLSDKDSNILTDELKLNKILSNLLENALKFTNEGFVELGYQLINNQLEIYVKDTGVGINPENQLTIFDRFSQEEKGLSQKAGGLGLGLSIARENAELLGGKIALQSEKGKGSNFFVTIPYNPVNPETRTTDFEKEESNIKKKQDKATILIVEDEEANFLYLETLLEIIMKFNCNILHAKHGKEAVEICNENSEIDLVLMDLKMPIMNGFEATKQINEVRPELPIVAQTAYAGKEDKDKALLAGCDDYISKPIEKHTLKEIINKHLSVGL